MQKVTCLTAISVITVLLTSGSAQAATFTEIGDAGELLNTAQTISQRTQPLTSIYGAVSGDADLFKIFLTGGQTFSATTISPDTFEIPIDDLLGSPTEILADPQLFLFDSTGRGVYSNDDTSFSSQSILPSGGFSPSNSGIYYLAISSFNYDPVGAGGKIFGAPTKDGVWGPTGPGGASPLSGFTGTSTTSGRYAIALTGAQPVPEPTSVLSVLALGAWGASRLKNQKKNRSK